jgi:hypothetical protein
VGNDKALNEGSLEKALSKGSSRPHTTHPAFGPRMREMLHRSPRELGKRTVVEADGLLGAQELAERVCVAFDCTHYEHLPLPEKVA